MTEKLTFIEINPGLGSLGFAAEKAGMLRLGPLLLSEDVRKAYLDFHGSGSDVPVDESADLVVADLPFSLFLDGKNADPDVTEVIAAARGAIRRGGMAVFRTKWDMGIRLGSDRAGYVDAVASAFPKYSIDSLVDGPHKSDAVATSDLYVIASPKPLSAVLEAPSDDPSVTGIHPARLEELDTPPADPQQFFGFLGFPEDFHRIAASVSNIQDRMRESAIVHRAARIIEAAASNLRG